MGLAWEIGSHQSNLSEWLRRFDDVVDLINYKVIIK